MLRSDLAARIATKHGLRREDAHAAVAAILDAMSAALAQGDRVELRGLCALSVKWQRARVGRNPRNGAEVAVPVKTAIRCKPGQDMVRRLNPELEIPSAQGRGAARPCA